MEAIRAFFAKISTATQRFVYHIKRLLISGLYRLVALVVGPTRAQNLASWAQRRRQQLRGRWHNLVDTSSTYYRPVAIIWKTFLFGLLFVAFYIFCVETNFLYLMGSMPSVEDLQNPQVAQSSEIYTSDGVMIGKFYTENRTPVAYDRISPNLIKALIATEDIRFYEHSGIDYKALAAVAAGIMTGATDRGGGSTVTQQLAKKLFKTRRREGRGLLGQIPVVNTVVYKTKEWLTAIKLERNFTKEEILTMYFNTVDFGNNTFGINTAAKTYFSKDPDSLNIQESAVLVGLQKATTTYNPIRNPKRSKERRDVVIGQMAKYGYLTKQQADSISQLPLELKTNFTTPYDGSANYFKNAVVKFVEKWGEENGYDLYTDGLKIYTTIDSRMQAHAEDAVSEKMRSLQREFENHWGSQNPWVDERGQEIKTFLQDVVKRTRRYQTLAAKYPNAPDSIDYYLNRKDSMTVFDWKTGGKMTVHWSSMDSLNYYKRILRAGMMAMEPYTGHIKAWVGDLDYEFFKYDHVRQGRRQPGSTFKPFVYVAAIDDSLHNMSPCDQIQDRPFEKRYEENGEEKVWRPRNSMGTFSYVNMSLRYALAQSINSVTAELTDQVGPASVIKYAKRIGITTPLKPVPSIGLGPFDVTLYDMVASYGTFVNGGTYTEPILVTKIEDRNGKVLDEFVPETRQAISRESAYLMVQMLKAVVEGGTGSRIRWLFPEVAKNGNEIGGKTGTTSNNSDGWFMAITRDLVVGAWVGGDDRSIHFRSTKLGEGAHTALPLVGSFLERTYKDKTIGLERGPFPKPTFAVSKPFQCPNPVFPRDTIETYDDSLEVPTRIQFDVQPIGPSGPPPPPIGPQP